MLIVTDIDCTLLSEKGELLAQNVAALERARTLGCTVVLATARSFPGALPIHQALGLDTPLIVGSGTLVYSPEGELLHSVPIAEAVARKVFALCEGSGLHWSLRTDGVALVHKDFDLSRPPYNDARYYRVQHPERFDAFVAISLFGEGARAFYDSHDWEGWGLTSAYYSPSHFDPREAVMLFSKAASKGEATRWLQVYLGLEHQPILAIGDSPADVCMFSLGTGVAPANSPDMVKAAAHWLAPHCDEGAVAAALERFVFNAEKEMAEHV